LIGAEHAHVDIGQGHYDGAGEGGGVDQDGGAQLLGKRNAIGQNQAAFGVGV
jgi:hypothetical protein